MLILFYGDGFWQPDLTRKMIYLSWNSRGLGNLRALHSSCSLIQMYKSNVICLFETLVHEKRIKEIKIKLMIIVLLLIVQEEVEGQSCFGENPFDCRLINFTQNFINMEVHYLDKPLQRFTSFYDFLERNKKKDSWQLCGNLLMIISSLSVSWEVLMISYQTRTKKIRRR